LNEAKRKLTDIAQWSYALLPFPSSKAAVNINEEAAPKSPEIGDIEPEPEVVYSCLMATTLQKLQLRRLIYDSDPRYSSSQLQRVHAFISNPSEKTLPRALAVAAKNPMVVAALTGK
jgi:hypothetical protein